MISYRLPIVSNADSHRPNYTIQVLLLMSFQESFVDMHVHVCAPFPVDNDTGLLVTGH